MSVWAWRGSALTAYSGKGHIVLGIPGVRRRAKSPRWLQIAPNGHQAISNHHSDSIMNIVSLELYCERHISYHNHKTKDVGDRSGVYNPLVSLLLAGPPSHSQNAQGQQSVTYMGLFHPFHEKSGPRFQFTANIYWWISAMFNAFFIWMKACTIQQISLKTKSCRDPNFVVTGGTSGCYHDKWRQNWHHKKSSLIPFKGRYQRW